MSFRLFYIAYYDLRLLCLVVVSNLTRRRFEGFCYIFLAFYNNSRLFFVVGMLALLISAERLFKNFFII